MKDFFYFKTVFPTYFSTFLNFFLGAQSLGGKDFLSFAQFVTSIARISEELVLRENLVATMSERLHFFCQHLETTVRSKQQWVKLQDFTKRLAFVA